MAAQFGESRVLPQVTQQEAPIQTNVFEAGASVFGQQASAQAQSGQASVGRGLTLLQQGLNTASAALDKGLDTWNKWAEQRAEEDAPALIKRDGNGQIVPPSSFYPPGISTRAYAEQYAKTSMALYKSYAEQELVNHSALMREKYPANPDAYAEQMRIKQQAMQQNLDPRVAPWIDVRAEQIKAQGVTQIAVVNQSARNAEIRADSNRQLSGIKEDARRQAAGSDVGQGGGGQVSGFNNNLGNIVPSDEQYHGGKGLPYLAPNGRKYETFQSAEEGVAAAHKLIKYRVDQAAKAGKTLSFGQLVEIWDKNAEPAAKANYAAMMAKEAGFVDAKGNGDASAIIPIDDPSRMAGMLKGMNQFEKGKRTFSDAAIENGIKLARGETAVPRTNIVSDAVVADPATAAKLADQALNSASLAERIQQIRDTRASIDPPAKIEADIVQMRIDAQLEVIGAQIRNSPHQFYGLDGNLNQGSIDAAEQRILQIARSGRFPGREKEVTDKLMGELNVAVNSAQRRAAQVVVDEKRTIAPQLRQMTADAAEAKLATLNGDSVRAGAITQRLEAQGRGYLSNTQLTDSAAMTLANAAFQNGSISRGALQEANTNRITGLGIVTNDPLASADQKAAAYQAAVDIRNTPEVYRELTSSQRAGLQGVMDDHVNLNFATQLAASNAKFMEFNTSPAKIDEIRKFQIEKGILKPQDIMRAGEIDSAAKAGYNAKHTQSDLAAEFVADHAAGRNSTPERLAAHKKELNWRPPGGANSVDFSKPDHVASVQEHYRKYGYLPDLAKSSLDNIVLSPDDAVAAGPKAMLETIRQVERAKIEKQTGKIYDPSQETLLEGNVAATVGKNYQYLDIATRSGALAASKVALESKGKAGASGQTPDQANASLNQSVKNMEKILSSTTLNPVTQAISRPLGVLGLATDDEVAYTEGMEPEQKMVRAAGQISGLGITDAITGMTGLGDRGVVTTVIDPNFAKSLVHNGGIHLATDGDAIRTGPRRDSAEDFVISTAMYTAIRNGDASFTMSADGKTRVLGWKTLGDQVGPSLNVKMTPTMEKNFAAQILATETARTGGGLREVDPARTFVRSYQAANGQLRFYIAEQDRNGNFTRGMDLAKDDPRIGLQQLATLKSATQAVIANAADPETYGKIVAAGGVVSGVGAAALIAKGDVVNNFWKMSTSIGYAVQQMQMAVNRPGMTEAMLGEKKLLSPDQLQAQQNMITMTQRLVQELDAEFKNIPDAPNAKAILSHMLDKHMPGTENTALRKLILDSGVYQPGRQPHVRTGPSRIGTESR